MAITRIYHPAELVSGKTIQLDKDVSHHLVRVLRMKDNENLVLFNGNGFEYAATITNASQKTCGVRIDHTHSCDSEPTLNITLLQGVCRNDRMDTVIQKATELGVTKIRPFTSQRSAAHARGQRIEKKLEHWRRVSISACEQSGRCSLPTIEATTSFHSAITESSETLKLLLDPEAENSIKQFSKPDGDISILIGPESGFTEEEIKQAKQQGFTVIRFGKRTLRTETAGPAFISAVQTLWGDMG